MVEPPDVFQEFVESLEAEALAWEKAAAAEFTNGAALAVGDFVEEDHPRDKSGEFTEKGGGVAAKGESGGDKSAKKPAHHRVAPTAAEAASLVQSLYKSALDDPDFTMEGVDARLADLADLSVNELLKLAEDFSIFDAGGKKKSEIIASIGRKIKGRREFQDRTRMEPEAKSEAAKEVAAEGEVAKQLTAASEKPLEKSEKSAEKPSTPVDTVSTGEYNPSGGGKTKQEPKPQEGTKMKMKIVKMESLGSTKKVGEIVDIDGVLYIVVNVKRVAVSDGQGSHELLAVVRPANDEEKENFELKNLIKKLGRSENMDDPGRTIDQERARELELGNKKKKREKWLKWNENWKNGTLKVRLAMLTDIDNIDRIRRRSGMKADRVMSIIVKGETPSAKEIDILTEAVGLDPADLREGHEVPEHYFDK